MRALRPRKLCEEEFDLWIVDGTLDDPADGFLFSLELSRLGKRVLMLSGSRPPTGVAHLPFLDKDDFDDDLLVTRVKELLPI